MAEEEAHGRLTTLLDRAEHMKVGKLERQNEMSELFYGVIAAIVIFPAEIIDSASCLRRILSLRL